MGKSFVSRKHLLAFASLLCNNQCDAFSLDRHSRNLSSLNMRPSHNLIESSSKVTSKMSTFEASTYSVGDFSSTAKIPSRSSLEDFVLPVLYTSMLVTSNTVGAGMLVLPELCKGPGMGASMGVFTAMYLVNLISGLVLAEVAIQQRQASGKEAPSSFKAFAEASIESPMAKDIIAAVSVMKNALVLAFGTMKAGILGNELFGLDPNAASIVWAVAFSALMGTQSSPNLSKVASIFVFGLFVSFAAILVPGLEQIPDPMAVFAMPGTSPDIWGSMMQALPIILMSFIFQNIVPTTARILDYDRIKIAIAVSMGTLFPYCMYSAWCLAVLGGGVDTSVGLDGPLFTIFSIVTIAGSHLGSSTSMAEELDTYLRPSKDDDEDRKNQVFSLRSVGITAVLAIGLGEGFANHLNDLLSLAGAYGSPFLYFVLPVAMAYNQSRKQAASRESSFPPQETSKDFTVSSATIPLAITAATGLVGSEVLRLL